MDRPKEDARPTDTDTAQTPPEKAPPSDQPETEETPAPVSSAPALSDEAGSGPNGRAAKEEEAAPSPESSPAAEPADHVPNGGEAKPEAADAEPAGKAKPKEADAAPPGKAEPELAETTPNGQPEKAGDQAGMGQLLSQAAAAPRELVTPKRGSRVTGKIVLIDEKGAFVDFGGREEGFLELGQLRNEKGEVTRKVGDTVQATVTSVEGGTKLALKAKRTGNLTAVLDAHKSGLPVDGKVTGVNKGGLVVRTLGVRAFCPFSQIDRRYTEDPSEYVGKRFAFRVTAADAKGKNIVLSRRALLEEQMRGHADKLRKVIAVGQELSGVVARVRPFGAFVDLGGVDGLVHLSEISHTRVKDPSDVLKVGQDVRVKVLKIEDLGGEKERISLSIKELLDDPWEQVAAGLTVGEKSKGKIVRLVDFGAFLEIAPGVDGLIHVSALAEGRVGHPSDVVEVGQTVDAYVVGVDRGTRRISLSLVDPALAQAGERPPRGGRPGKEPRGRREARESREVREYRESTRQSEGGMTSMEEAFQRLRDQSNDD